eukprot:TRINITY_DN5976_c0_g1_i1.p1 TRINITY_DN5976_c0_g1~~TRINITY_DN5976_c0_g1_i1.p1  ORF type:complete len:182 (+),score=49.06 TRINITY_DN5976_c0_g1_i1:175-720(+)
MLIGQFTLEMDEAETESPHHFEIQWRLFGGKAHEFSLIRRILAEFATITVDAKAIAFWNRKPQITAPSSVFGFEDTMFSVGKSIILEDIDTEVDDDLQFSIKISVPSGECFVSSLDSVVVVFISGTASAFASLECSGKLDLLNELVRSLSYKALPNEHGPREMEISLSDLGGSGEIYFYFF